MKELINTYLSLVFKIGTAIVVLSTLFLFTNLTTDLYDTPKFIVLAVFTSLLLVLLTLKFTITGKVAFIRTPLDIPLLLLLVVGIVSTILSPAPYVSFLGNQLRISTSLVAIITYVLFYFLLTNNLRSLKDVKSLLYLSLISGAILSVISLSAYMGVTLLPKPWTHGTNFTPTGSTFSTSAVLAMLLPIIVSGIFTSTNLTFKLLNSSLLALFGVTIALTGTWASWIAALVAVAVSFLINYPVKELGRLNHNDFIKLTGLIVPLVMVALVIALSFIPPMKTAKNPFYTQAKNFPREIQLSFPISWKISVSSFRDSPFWGTGPSTYLFDFTSYKPIEFNQTKVWNLRFDSSFNEYLVVLATLGGIGLIALLSLTALFISSASKALKPHHPLAAGLAISGIVFLIILALHSATLVVWVMGLLILGSYMAVNLLSQGNRETFSTAKGNITQTLLRIGLSSDSSEETVRMDALPAVLLILALGLVLAVFFFGGKFVLADYHHRKALNAVSQNQGVSTYNELVTAEKLNLYNDLYRTDLAQTNFALANAIAQAKGPTEASPSGSLSDQDKQNIQVLLQQSINEGRSAVQLSPRSAVNWEILALLYRQISGVAQNALIFALDAYGRAIFQDPLNPILRLNVGGTYFAIKNYDLAIRFFTDSINLKPDFANGYYNLAVALKDKGDLNSALLAAQKVVDLVDKNSQDYQVANNLLQELKGKTGQATTESNLTAPTAQDRGALQQEKLPKVLDVGNPPEKIATPPAIKKPNSTPEPTPQP